MWAEMATLVSAEAAHCCRAPHSGQNEHRPQAAHCFRAERSFQVVLAGAGRHGCGIGTQGAVGVSAHWVLCSSKADLAFWDCSRQIYEVSSGQRVES